MTTRPPRQAGRAKRSVAQSRPKSSPQAKATSATMPAAPPRRVLIEVIGRYHWLNPAVMDIMRQRYGTRFIVIAGSEEVRAWYLERTGPEDEILTYDEIEDVEISIDPEADAQKAWDNEEAYATNYLLDIIQQDRAIFGTYLPYAASSWSKRPTPSLELLTARINHYFQWADDLLRRNQIDLVLIRPTGICNTTIIHVAMARGLPISMSRPSRYASYVTWTYGPYSANNILKQAYEQAPRPKALPEIEILPPEGSRQVFEAYLKRRSLRSFMRTLLLIVYNQSVKTYRALIVRKTGKLPPMLSPIRDQFQSRRLEARLEALSKKDLAELSEKPFVLLLLPKEPEYTVQSLAREFSNVKAIAQQLALALPAGFNLVIKEHSRIGYRSMSFYTDLLKLPNVLFASARIPGISLIRESRAVATVAGTAAVEAALVGKRAVIFTDRVEYSFLPSIAIVASFRDLAKTLRDAVRPLSDKESDEFRRCGLRYRAAIVATSFDARGTKVFDGDGELDPGEAERAVDILMRSYEMQLGHGLRQGG